jgi:hypothetical protein
MYKELSNVANEDERVRCWIKGGLCREWSNEFSLVVKDLAKEKGLEMEVEVREVNLCAYLTHSLVWIKIKGERPYLCDGVGVEKHEPYFGFEDEAPSHLQNSRLDMIEVYRRASA